MKKMCQQVITQMMIKVIAKIAFSCVILIYVPNIHQFFPNDPKKTKMQAYMTKFISSDKIYPEI